MRIALVAAVAEGRVIGAGGDLAWKISDDLKWFKTVTLGKPVIMGRKTFQSIGKPLPDRDNIVVTRSRKFDPGGVFIVRSIASAIRLAGECARQRGADEICIIGGGQIYAQTVARADRIYLTRVNARVDGDVYFPEIEPTEWIEKAVGGCDKSDRNSHDCGFFILDRRRK